MTNTPNTVLSLAGYGVLVRMSLPTHFTIATERRSKADSGGQTSHIRNGSQELPREHAA
ncbi:hypothetical protein HHU13_11250 [Nocardia globerula]|nr:hypothetical protein [Nocardia globerula]